MPELERPSLSARPEGGYWVRIPHLTADIGWVAPQGGVWLFQKSYALTPTFGGTTLEAAVSALLLERCPHRRFGPPLINSQVARTARGETRDAALVKKIAGPKCLPCERGWPKRHVGFIGPGKEREVFIHQDGKRLFPCSGVPYAGDWHFLICQILVPCRHCKATCYLVFKHDTPATEAGIFTCQRCRKRFAVARPVDIMTPCHACGILRRTAGAKRIGSERHDCLGQGHAAGIDGTVCGNAGEIRDPVTCTVCLTKRPVELELVSDLENAPRVDGEVADRTRLLELELDALPPDDLDPPDEGLKERAGLLEIDD